MDINTVIWSLVLFGGSYASVMATGDPSGVFYWPAVASGFAAVIAYHQGKSQIVSRVAKAIWHNPTVAKVVYRVGGIRFNG